jgi:hypothetical protein
MRIYFYVGRWIYNYRMSFKRFTSLCLLVLVATGAFNPPAAVKAEEIAPAPAGQVSA